MSEPFFRASTPDDRQTIEIVLNEQDGLVEFWGRVAVDGNWAIPLEELKTHSQQKILGWAQSQMTQMMRRSE